MALGGAGLLSIRGYHGKSEVVLGCSRMGGVYGWWCSDSTSGPVTFSPRNPSESEAKSEPTKMRRAKADVRRRTRTAAKGGLVYNKRIKLLDKVEPVE